jgi:hypothetical protein
MLVIASAAYAVAELCAEFGRLPPAFLPIGHRRLYDLQLEWAFQHYGEVVLTLPSDYEIPAYDRAALDRLRVRIVRTHPDLGLADALSEGLDAVYAEGPLDILYGDTLFDQVTPIADSIVVGRTSDYYDWRIESRSPVAGDADVVWAGLFCFSDSRRIRELARESASFMAAVERYSSDHRPLARREARKWYDFGHVQTYFGSRQAISTTRHFNSLSVQNGVMTKRSADGRKMAAEAAWFETAPHALRLYQPQYLGRELDENGATLGYSLEYLPLPSLSDLFVFGELPARSWERILRSCGEFLDAAKGVSTPGGWSAHAAESLYLHKTLDRVELYARESGISLDAPWRINGEPVPSIRRIIAHAWDRVISSSPGHESYVHGDFCFSNILYDFRAQRIKVVDPRGLDGTGKPSAFCDARYDIAKLAHSALGLYDVLIAGQFDVRGSGHSLELEFSPRKAPPLETLLERLPLRGRPMRDWDVHPIMVLLFLSMLPLHGDVPRRQQGLLANALRLFRGMLA